MSAAAEAFHSASDMEEPLNEAKRVADVLMLLSTAEADEEIKNAFLVLARTLAAKLDEVENGRAAIFHGCHADAYPNVKCSGAAS